MIAALLLLQVRCQFALIAENGALGAGTPFWVAARFRPQPGWHVYWQNPGDSGLPTVLEWELPAGYKVTETRWPAPAVFESSGIITFGYDREFSVLARISPPADERGGGIIALRARADWMACKEACETGSSKSTL
ncbi:MAG: protein-disulfide reductase DsbD domain-containing protein, partial [Fimbriimonadaceae bacterium]